MKVLLVEVAPFLASGGREPPDSASRQAWLPEVGRGCPRVLAVKNQEGDLTETEQRELEAYRRVGRLLDLLSANARRALHQHGLSALIHG